MRRWLNIRQRTVKHRTQKKFRVLGAIKNTEKWELESQFHHSTIFRTVYAIFMKFGGMFYVRSV